MNRTILIAVMLVILVILIIAIIVSIIVDRIKKHRLEGDSERSKPIKSKKQPKDKKKSKKYRGQIEVPDVDGLSGENSETDDKQKYLVIPQYNSPIVVITDIKTAKEYCFEMGVRVVIGRKSDLNDISFPYDPAVSEQHCFIEYLDGAYILNDYRSSNGTFYNGEIINGRSTLVSGSTIKVGNNEMKFEIR